jgi:myo-inositol 2-dehydrogenase / D-chiro-inositol 1-dehydrogenase
VVSTSRLGVGFIGAGAVTQAIHLPTLARLTADFEVRQIFDVAADVASSVAARVGASATTSLEELLAEETVEVVAVCSPHQLHASQVIAACRAGKRAVLCEKPVATTAEQAAEIAAVAAETKVPVLVGAMHTFDPAWKAAVDGWGDLASSAVAVRSSIVLPPNARFEDVATEVAGRAAAAALEPAPAEQHAQLLHDMVLGLTIHDLPLIRAVLPDFADLTVLEARVLEPRGYHVVVSVAGRRVELHALISRTWRPSWQLEITGPDQQLRCEFTPSYVHGGSAVARLHTGTSALTFGPFASNGYEAEWRELGEIVHGDRRAPDPAGLVDDLRFAIAVADASAAAIRGQATEVAA